MQANHLPIRSSGEYLVIFANDSAKYRCSSIFSIRLFPWEQEKGPRISAVKKKKKRKNARKTKILEHSGIIIAAIRKIGGSRGMADRQKFKLPKVKGNPDREEADEGSVACTKGKRMRPEMSQDTWPVSLRAASLFVLARSSNPGHEWRQRPKYIYDARNWRLDPYIGCFEKPSPLKLFIL